MNNNEYLDSLIEELKADGVELPAESISTSARTNLNDKELQTILDMEKITGKKYSDEQRKILEHHGNACILACAGSGKTTISTHLIAKRIMTGEIKDVNKLIYTTYSKAGAKEMQDRLDVLLDQLGIKAKVKVRTIHSFFLQVLRTFGVTAEIIEPGDRTKFIKQACREAEFVTKDDELMTLDNLLSYQVNNLLSDKKTIESYVNTLEELSLEQYSKIRKSYAEQKNTKKVIDYDDMQSLLYLWLVKFAKSANESERDTAKSVRDYCKAVWTDFYIDEAQDTSKIQFAIIRAMVADENDKNKLDKGLVFIGDDDQCLLEDTLITTDKGLVPIKDIKVGDKVLSVSDKGIVKSTVMDTYSHGLNNSIPLVKITTASGKSYTATADHKVMVKIPDSFKEDTIDINGNQYVISDAIKEFINEYGEELLPRIRQRLPVFGYILELPHFGKDIKTNNGYVITSAMSLSSGMIFSGLISENEDKLEDDIITSVEAIDKADLIEADKRVYCLNLSSNHNYFANGLLTHNCIYQWRGGDPSIILSLGPTFDIPTFVLSTNYRCYNEIVDYAATGIKCNNSRYAKGMSAFMNGGSVKILPSIKEDLCSLSILAMNHIKWWLSQGHRLNDIAVLSRNNFHLALLSNMLLREGIYCNMTEDMKLTKSYMYQDVKDIISVSEPTWKKELTSKVLWKLCRYMGVSNARVIAEFQDSCNLSLEDALGWLIKHFIDKDIDFSKKININIQAEQKIQYYINKLSADTRTDMYTVYKAISCKDREEAIRTLLFQYLSASSFMYKSKDKNRSIIGLVQYIINLMKKDGVDKMIDFLRVTEQLENGKMAIPGEKMTLTTIHSAKGREWKDVIMFACDNVSQPSFDGIYGMLEDGVSVHDIYENIDEERRLFYVGNTRAKENLLVLTYTQPSIFILEALGAFKNKHTGNNDTVLNCINNQEWVLKYSDFIKENILDPESKYYYNSNNYKLDKD